MTRQQFEFVVKKAMEEFLETNEEHNMQMAIINPDGTLDTFGYGCPGCIAEAISDNLDAGSIQHNAKDVEACEKVH